MEGSELHPSPTIITSAHHHIITSDTRPTKRIASLQYFSTLSKRFQMFQFPFQGPQITNYKLCSYKLQITDINAVNASVARIQITCKLVS